MRKNYAKTIIGLFEQDLMNSKDQYSTFSPFVGFSSSSSSLFVYLLSVGIIRAKKSAMEIN